MKDNINEIFENLKPLVVHTDVPNLPRTDSETWNTIIVPNLLKAGAIRKSKLEDGKLYYGDYRSSKFGRWDSIKNRFIVNRWKFQWCEDYCNHFEDDDKFALFVPIRLATEEENINELEKK